MKIKRKASEEIIPEMKVRDAADILPILCAAVCKSEVIIRRHDVHG